MTFTTMPSRPRRASDAAASAFGRSMNTRKPTNSRSLLVGVAERVDARARSTVRDRDHARAGVVELGAASSCRAAGTAVAAREHALGLALHDHASVRRRARRRATLAQPALVVERAATRRASSRRAAAVAASLAAVPQRDVERVAAHDLARAEHRLVAHETEHERRARSRPDRRRRADRT